MDQCGPTTLRLRLSVMDEENHEFTMPESRVERAVLQVTLVMNSPSPNPQRQASRPGEGPDRRRLR